MLAEPTGSFVICPSGEFKGKSNFWINRFGVCYIVQEFGHHYWAQAHMDCIVDELENEGWIHYSGHQAYCWTKRLTKSQESAILDICIANSRKYTDTIRDLYCLRGNLTNV